MPKSRIRKKTAKKNKHAKINPNDNSIYLNNYQKKRNNNLKQNL